MPSEVREIDPVHVELTVEVPWDRVKKGLDVEFGQLQRSARVKGFRPGRVPRNVVRRLFGRQVRGEVAAQLVEEGLLAAVQEHELRIVASPEVDALPAITDGEAMRFVARLEVRPKVAVLDLDGLEVTRTAVAVTDEDVDREIAQLQERHAEIRAPEPMRPAREGDVLTIAYEVEVDGEAQPEMAADEREVTLGEGRLLPEFEQGLLGTEPEGRVEIRMTYPDDTAKEELRGKTALFQVQVLDLREKVLPEPDDSFAQDVSEHDTLAALRAELRSNLEDAMTSRGERDLRDQVIDRLVDKNPIPVPPSLVAQQQQALRQEFEMFQRFTGQAEGIDGEAEAMLKERAERKVRAALLMGEIARREDLAVTDEHVEAKLQEIARDTGKHIAKVRVEYAGERRESLENRLLEDRLLGHLLARATIREASADAEDGEEGQPGEEEVADDETPRAAPPEDEAADGPDAGPPSAEP
ncbi:MAG: trigger factor [Sandaracinaceae bacterium]